MRSLILFSVFALAACSTTPSALSPSDVAKAEVALTSAEQAALIYTSLPRCPQPSGLCSQTATVAAIKKADAVAYAALIAVVDGPSLATAEAAISALLAIVPVT